LDEKRRMGDGENDKVTKTGKMDEKERMEREE
jgi:hypothetical protein